MPVRGGDRERLPGDGRLSKVGNERRFDALRQAGSPERHEAGADGEACKREGGGKRQRPAAAEDRPAGARRGEVDGRGGRHGRDPVGERLRRRLARRMAADRRAQRREPPIFRRQRRIVAHRAFEFERAHGVELAVERRIELEDALFIPGHDWLLRVLASAARARASRDMTVPIGAPVASAMSR